MSKVVFFLLIGLAVIAVAVADVFLKKAAVPGQLGQTFKSPWFLGALVLYLFQIFFFTYVFVQGFQLSIVGILQTILYALVVLGAGILLFQETLSALQIVGVVLGVVSILLITLEE